MALGRAGELAGRTTVITGAAGAIGRAISLMFLCEQSRVVLVDINEAALGGLESELKATFPAENILAIAADVRITGDVDEIFRQAALRFGQVDILVNNAAVTQIKPLVDVGDDDIDWIIDTNLKAYVKCARAAVRCMLEKNIKGALLFVSSKNGLEGASEKSLYCATKGAELTLARSLAKELGSFGIRINSICPDAVLDGSALWRTDNYRLGTCRRYGIKEDEISEYYKQRCALKTNISPQDVADAALFLVSERAAKITGAILAVDGGVTFVR